MKYWVERWSELRMKEMIRYPEEFVIHNDYIKLLPEEDIRSGFGELFDVLYQIYRDASLDAEGMLLPAHDMNEYRYLSKEERLSRGVSYKYAKLLYALGRVGELANSNHNLIYRQQDDGKCEMHITTPKTEAGKRIVPMFEAVRKALLQEKKQQMKHGFNSTVIDGYSGFVFTNRCGYVHNPQTINRAIKRIYKACNEQETERAKKEHRQPVLIPHFSVHNLRHTFCTRFCENETDLKIIQEIMGHSDITTTMNIYNEATKERKQESFARLEGKIKIC